MLHDRWHYNVPVFVRFCFYAILKNQHNIAIFRAPQYLTDTFIVNFNHNDNKCAYCIIKQ